MSRRTAQVRLPRAIPILVMASALAFCASSAYATFHAVNVSEVYTNANGSVQFVELQALTSLQTQMQHTRVVAYNADSTVTTLLFDFTTTINWNTNQHILLATAAFQDTAGFAPDFVIPSGLSFPSGRACLNRDPGELGAVVVDGVAYGSYSGANTGYGTPAAPLPTDGFQSLKRVVFGIANRNNSTDWVVAANSPTRLDGTTTVLHNPTGVPGGSGWPVEEGRTIWVQSRPNPMRDEVQVEFSLREGADVTLQLFGVDGRLVRTIAAGRLSAGPQAIRWDGRDADGRPAPGGVYVYRVSADQVSAARRLLLIR